MRKWLLALAVTFIGGAMVVQDVEAKRLGGARSSGIQRSAPATPPASTPARPAQQQAAPAQQGAQQPAAAAGATAAAPAAATGLSKWMPMLGGLALGGMLGYLFGANGLGGLLLLALLAVAAVLVFRALARRSQAPERPMQLAGLGNETVAAPPPSQAAGFDRPVSAGRAGLPAGFDAAGFIKAAKMNFVRLQLANDAGEVEDIREFTTPELFEELRRDVSGRGPTQHTDVQSLDAQIIEVATEGAQHWVSVRFSGMISEAAGEPAQPFAEVWNLVKPVDGSSGWLLAGIQQVQ